MRCQTPRRFAEEPEIHFLRCLDSIRPHVVSALVDKRPVHQNEAALTASALVQCDCITCSMCLQFIQTFMKILLFGVLYYQSELHFFFKFYIRFNFIPILTRNFINYAHFLRFDYLLNLLKRTIERKTTCFIENTKFQKYTVVLLN